MAEKVYIEIVPAKRIEEGIPIPEGCSYVSTLKNLDIDCEKEHDHKLQEYDKKLFLIKAPLSSKFLKPRKGKEPIKNLQSKFELRIKYSNGEEVTKILHIGSKPTVKNIFEKVSKKRKEAPFSFDSQLDSQFVPELDFQCSKEFEIRELSNMPEPFVLAENGSKFLELDYSEYLERRLIEQEQLFEVWGERIWGWGLEAKKKIIELENENKRLKGLLN